MASLTDPSNRQALEALRARYPWPDQHPAVATHHWSLDGGGRWLVKEKIRKSNLQLVLEIGSFLGGSVLDWLKASPDVVVVAIDPWPPTSDEFCLSDYARKQGQCEELVRQLSRPDGFYETFVANVWQHRDRLIPVREFSPGILRDLSDLGLRPDLIYLDSDKSGTEINLCNELFPGAIMTGDDWGWKNSAGEYAIREPVQKFCELHKRYLKIENATWVIDNEPPSLAFQFRSWRRSLKQKYRHHRKLRKAA